MRKELILAGAALATVGCQTYAPISLASAPVGSDVRVVLTDRGRADLGPAVGAGTESVEGTLRSFDSTEVKISVDKVRELDGGERKWNKELVTIPRDAVALASSRKISVVRSALLASVFVGAAVVFAVSQAVSENIRPRQPGTGGTGSQ